MNHLPIGAVLISWNRTFIIGLLLLLASIPVAAQKTLDSVESRSDDELIGPVESVEYSFFEVTGPPGNEVGTPNGSRRDEYSPIGHLTRSFGNDPKIGPFWITFERTARRLVREHTDRTWPSYQVVYEADESGRLVTYTHYSAPGRIHFLEKYRTESGGGWRSESVIYDSLGKLLEVQTFQYDSSNRVVRHHIDHRGVVSGYYWVYDSSGRILSKYLCPDTSGCKKIERFEYDQGRLARVRRYARNVDGAVITQWKESDPATVKSYDAGGHMIESSDGRDRTLFEYDAAGNWVRQIEMMRITSSETSKWMTFSEIRRRITYYPR
jgi:hypothetical protein